MHEAQDRAKDLRARDLALRRHIDEQRGKDKCAVLVACRLLVPPIHQHLRTLLGALTDQPFDTFAAFGTDDRPHLYAGVQPVADLAR